MQSKENMTDLVTRLLALADILGPAGTGATTDLLREAAATIALHRKNDLKHLEIIEAWKRRAEKAEAEAAALRDAAASYIEPWEPGVDDVGSGASKAIAWRRLNAALSQPGPGAAYQAYVRKLEAVADAVRQVKDHPLIRSTLSDPSMGNATGSLWIDWKRAFDALAALEETP